MEFRYHHLHLRSPDPDATAQYYREMFGAEVTRSVYPAGSPYAGKPRVAMTLGGQRFLIAPAHPRETAEAPQAPHFGIEHIGLTVADIDAAVAELTAKSADFERQPAKTPTGNRNAFVRGPEGVLVEIIQLG